MISPRHGEYRLHEYLNLIEAKKEKLARVNVEDLNLRGSHLLLSLDEFGSLVKGSSGVLDVRICNFELLRSEMPPDKSLCA